MMTFPSMASAFVCLVVYHMHFRIISKSVITEQPWTQTTVQCCQPALASTFGSMALNRTQAVEAVRCPSLSSTHSSRMQALTQFARVCFLYGVEGRRRPRSLEEHIHRNFGS